jgi:hypothetical protein
MNVKTSYQCFCFLYSPLLVTFAKLRKPTVSFVMSICLSVRLSVEIEQFGLHWKDCNNIWYLNIFRKSVEKIQVLLKSNEINGYFSWKPMYVYDHITLILRMRNISDKVVEYVKTYILYSMMFLRKESTDENVIRKICFACWITEATATNSEYVMLLASSRQQLLCERVSILLVHYIANIVQNLITLYWLKCDFTRILKLHVCVQAIVKSCARSSRWLCRNVTGVRLEQRVCLIPLNRDSYFWVIMLLTKLRVLLASICLLYRLYIM